MSEGNGVIARHVPTGIPEKVAIHIQPQMPEVAKILPRDVALDKFWAGAWLEFVTTPKLNDCTPQSLLKAVLKAAILGHVPGRDCNFLPFKRRQGKDEWLEATMVEYYHGILRRLDRTGRVEWAKAEPVYKNDHFKCDELMEVYEFERHLDGERGKLRCFFSAIKLKGSQRLLVRPCTIEDVDKVRAASPGKDQDPWVKWYEEKGRVTALKKHAKYLQLIDEEAEEADMPVATHEEARGLIADTHGDHDAAAAARERAIRRDPLPEEIVDMLPPPLQEHIRKEAGSPPTPETQRQTKQEVSLLAAANKLVRGAAEDFKVKISDLWLAIEALADEGFDRDHLTPTLYGMVGTWALQAAEALAQPSGPEADTSWMPEAELLAWIESEAGERGVEPEVLKSILDEYGEGWATTLATLSPDDISLWKEWAGGIWAKDAEREATEVQEDEALTSTVETA